MDLMDLEIPESFPSNDNNLFLNSSNSWHSKATSGALGHSLEASRIFELLLPELVPALNHFQKGRWADLSPPYHLHLFLNCLPHYHQKHVSGTHHLDLNARTISGDPQGSSIFVKTATFSVFLE